MIHLRSFQPADLEELYRIDQVCFPSGIAYSKTELRYYLQHPRAYSAVALDDTAAIVGFCTGHLYLKDGRSLGHIITIDILPDARGKGAGRMLMESVEGHFRTRHATAIGLEVAVDNVAAQNFYQHLGYRTTRRIPRYYLDRLDAFAMEKLLQ